ncbi:LacI family DNA-binding transcriptional regulator [Treponema sp. C6A8]|uniref:LacI family DNA-binding transcriptional regulator n=1 Tax=Treponema sp. C6A8 TaxID=1410609 RepID=UPI0004805A34|nr:LacI family DNA-binding transcriptional regulator [Treponema sp. C6A8]
MATIKEIAALAGVSPTTVSNVIHGNTKKVSPEKYKKVQKILDEIHFAPNLAASMLAHNTSHIVGIILNYDARDDDLAIQDPYVSAIIGTLEQNLQKNGYYTMLYSNDDFSKWIKLISTWNMAGLILLGVSGHKAELVRQSANVPVVFIDSYLSDEEKDEKSDGGKSFFNVGLEDLYGGFLMTEYLIECGHRKIAFLADNTQPSGVDAFRLIGLKNSLLKHGISFGPDGDCDFVPITKNKEKRLQIVEKLISQKRFTALFFASDFYASEAVQNLEKKGHSIPDEVSVVGFDNNSYAEFSNPGLTTVNQDIFEKGKSAVSLLVSLIRGESVQECNVRLPVKLVIRDSVKKI